MRKLLAMLVIVSAVCGIGYAAKTLVFNETELVKLVPEGSDPDSDPITYSFSEPLNEKGEWQTTYGDAGEYEVAVTASDGELTTTEQVTLIVNKKEVSPEIETSSPAGDIHLSEGGQQEFSISATDLNDDELEYIWYVDEEIVGYGFSFIYAPTYFEAGQHTIRAVVSDGEKQAAKEWDVHVADVNRTELLDSFSDITIDEGESIDLELPDFASYNLEYSIGEPIGDDGSWETGYDNAGTYSVRIEIRDGDFYADKDINLEVNNLDRGPVLGDIGNVRIRENQKVEIEINAADPDGDEISFSAENLPDGSSFEDNVFSWQTTHDTVTKQGAVDNILDKFHLLSRTFVVRFIAESNGLTDTKDTRITVRDVNRAPVIEDIGEMIVNEGETFAINPNITDPDGDKTSYSCSGWIDKCEYTPSYEEAGAYIVKVKATDGFLYDTEEITVRVADTNRMPSLVVDDQMGFEGEEIRFKVSAGDPDGDPVEIRLVEAPEKSMFEGNIFSWIPDYDVSWDSSQDVRVKFAASDGKAEIQKDVIITVHNTNRAPDIINITPVQEFTTYAGSQIRFEVVAEDPDGDRLSYRWKFGLFEEYNATSVHLRTFQTTGMKTITVEVSDSEESASYSWTAHVIAPKKNISEKQEKKTETTVTSTVTTTVIKQETIPTTTTVIKQLPPPSTAIKQNTAQVVQKKDYIYDRYTIVHNGDVEEKSKERLIVQR